jgi:hypothetical protein
MQSYRDDLPTLSFWLSSVSVLLYNLCHDEKTEKEGISIGSIQSGLRILDGNLSPSSRLKGIFIRVYTMVLDHIYRTLKPLSLACIEPGDSGRKNMRQIVVYCSSVLTSFQQYFVHIELVKVIFHQIFLFLDATLFNEVILRRDLATWTNAMDLKMKVAALEDWFKVLEISEDYYLI